MKKAVAVVVVCAFVVSSGLLVSGQAPTQPIQPPISLTPPPIPWLVIHPRDPSDQGFRHPPSKVVVGISMPDDLEICIERFESATVCVTVKDILDAIAKD